MEDKTFLREMGSRIALRRKALHLTQEEMAEKIEVSTQMISNLETGKKVIRPENLSRLCKALDISADYILTGSLRQPPEDPVFQSLSALSPKELRMITELIEYMKEK